MAGAVNGIVGDSFVADIPESVVEERDLTEERNAAKFAKTKEFQRIKDHFKARMAYYQAYLPDGRSVMEQMPTPEQWQAANIVIAEFKGVLDAYERAAEVVADAAKRQGL